MSPTWYLKSKRRLRPRFGHSTSIREWINEPMDQKQNNMPPRHDDDDELPGYSLEPQTNLMDMRIPEFSRKNPELWFLIMENNFKIAGIVADSTKYAHVVSSLGSHIAEIHDIILNPPVERAYDFIKSEVIKRLNVSHEHKMQLLHEQKIGDRKPSQFLHHLRSLADNVDDKILRTIWLNGLPIFLQPRLVMRTNDSLDQLAYTADMIMDMMPAPSLQVAETVRSSEIHNVEQDDEARLIAQIARTLHITEPAQPSTSRDARQNEIRISILKNENIERFLETIKCEFDQLKSSTPQCIRLRSRFRSRNRGSLKNHSYTPNDAGRKFRSWRKRWATLLCSASGKHNGGEWFRPPDTSSLCDWLRHGDQFPDWHGNSSMRLLAQNGARSETKIELRTFGREWDSHTHIRKPWH